MKYTINDIKNGYYTIEDRHDIKTKVRIRNNEKSIIFELIDEPPKYNYADIQRFLYDKGKKVMQKRGRERHGLFVVNDSKFVLYPYQSGNPYLFERIDDK
jgi:hypothetical protein